MCINASDRGKLLPATITTIGNYAGLIFKIITQNFNLNLTLDDKLQSVINFSLPIYSSHNFLQVACVRLPLFSFNCILCSSNSKCG